MTALLSPSAGPVVEEKEIPRGLFRAAAGFLVVLLWVQCLIFARTNGQTVDETFYSGIGYSIARYGNYENLGEHPPLMIHLGALPLLAVRPDFPIDHPVLRDGGAVDISATGAKFLYQMNNDADLILFLQRVPVTFVTAALAVVIAFWARELWGRTGALAALFLCAFSPNVIAHGSLYTTDMGAAFFFFLAVYRVKKFAETLKIRDAFTAGVCLGLALLTKVSTVILLPIAFIQALFFVRRREAAEAGRIFLPPAASRWFGWAAVLLMLFSLGQKLVIAVLFPVALSVMALAAAEARQSAVPGCLLERPIVKILIRSGWIIPFAAGVLIYRKFPFISIAALAWTFCLFALNVCLWTGRISAAVRYPVQVFCLMVMTAAAVVILGYVDFPAGLARLNPFRHYLHSFLWAFSHAHGGHGSCSEGSFVTCDWRYFFEVMALKTPLLTIALFTAGCLVLARLKPARRDVGFLLIPPALFFLVASTVNQIHIGLRHVLIVYPFIFLIAAGAVIFVLRKFTGRLRGFILGLLLVLFAAYAGESLANFPHHLSYFNWAVGRVERGARLVGDSNLNWGQDNRRLIEYVREKKIPHIRLVSVARNKEEYDYHGLPWSDLPVSEYSHPGPGFCALDVYYYAAEQKKPDSWFRDRKPLARVGKTFYVFEVPAS